SCRSASRTRCRPSSASRRRAMGSNTPTSAPSASSPLWKGWPRTYWIDRAARRNGSKPMSDARSRRRGTPAAVLATLATLSPAGQTVPNARPDSRGVITYANYQVAVARDGDTVATVAARVGTTPGELARRNALPEDTILRPGEVLLLPDSVPRPDSFGAAGLD